eukprot:CAMPEP_0197937418 /NCGR_PEP_ID=MMETSP1439-20131203/116473_1 /TAXON_ID=66791 /ORGANISM="Gonyaulax spinifera, Strain CCMP409" /LENGTH=245 /DNA_ID=CAMNT_0043560445 /DNA_START=183 /DNA_END=918 /DNA_ORIENTATION=+
MAAMEAAPASDLQVCASLRERDRVLGWCAAAPPAPFGLLGVGPLSGTGSVAGAAVDTGSGAAHLCVVPLTGVRATWAACRPLAPEPGEPLAGLRGGVQESFDLGQMMARPDRASRQPGHARAPPSPSVWQTRMPAESVSLTGWAWSGWARSAAGRSKTWSCWPRPRRRPRTPTSDRACSRSSTSLSTTVALGAGAPSWHLPAAAAAGQAGELHPVSQASWRRTGTDELWHIHEVVDVLHPAIGVV